jgi:hypothetical protein
MAWNDFKRIFCSDRDLNRVQENMAEFARQFKNPFLAGILIDSMVDEDPQSANFGKSVPITLSTTTKKVQHLLGREPQGYVVVSQNAAVSVYKVDYAATTNSAEIAANKVDALKYINLKASGNVTVKLWVF